jgi:hypothetical protein
METGDEVILMKGRAGRVIGFEKLNFTAAPPEQLRILIHSCRAAELGSEPVSWIRQPSIYGY